MGLLRMAARTAVVAGTATAVSGRVAQRQALRYEEQHAQAFQQEAPPAAAEDDATAHSGGDMGYVNREKVIPNVLNAAYSLEPGQVSDILATPYGLEIIKLEEKRTKPFDEVRPSLELQFRQVRANEITQRLVEQYHVVIDQEFFAGQPANPASRPSPPSH